MQDLNSFDGPERRRKTRFPIELGARYSVQVRQEIEGEGLTVNISSRGVLMTSAHDLLPGALVSVVIEWPIPIDNAHPLALHLHGTVVRSEHGLVAVQFWTHELRTRPKPPQGQLVTKWRVISRLRSRQK
jgi:hypothetical protein